MIILLTTATALAQIPPQYTTNFSPPDSASTAARLEVSFVDHAVQDGEALSPSLYKSAPTPRLYLTPPPPFPYSCFRDDDGDNDIIIICIDPDSHKPLELAHWIHSGWRRRYSNNGSSTSDSSCNLETHVEAELAYIPPTPPPADGMGWHRYIFLAFARRDSSRKIIGIPGSNGVGEGVIWNMTEWRLKNGLDMPFAGTYFKAISNHTSLSLAPFFLGCGEDGWMLIVTWRRCGFENKRQRGEGRRSHAVAQCFYCLH